jgi:hypothetical protein
MKIARWLTTPVKLAIPAEDSVDIVIAMKMIVGGCNHRAGKGSRHQSQQETFATIT